MPLPPQPVRRSCPILLAVNDTCGVTRMTSTCAARVPSLRWAPQRGWVGSWVSVRPAKCRTSGGHAVVCAAVSFRPCIDIHKGKVKQIVGSTLRDLANDSMELVTNFESDKSPAEFAKFYKADELLGGHVIMLGANPSSQAAALEALRAYPGENLLSSCDKNYDFSLYIFRAYLHYIHISICFHWSKDTSASSKLAISCQEKYVFSDGKMNTERLRKLVELVGKQRLVLDLSCRKKDGRYTIVTDRLGIDEELVELLGHYSPIPVTYAGGVSTMDDLERIKKAGKSRVDVTIGSALDIFGGDLPYKDVVLWHRKQSMVGQV
ncbi:1-(5-phosphoribosyl)-5-[(5-phosphoribosylamino)methylideneamino] imidazole-4-carboxamide isomerase chloroplastic [Zea mays]|uniref:1-(5-phosphoribosyl)-5-[(5-phosphoribosylamino)methylideneamino] imidazole-4-carboxamide isomerase chloroplastic n=1 Tax=Zea mays TaxID=4577 RepID=A0A1D6M3Q3_MAIZE|nr:1-(5-phosphoribosyl)-5-[(5-phosphoribosylamino)methylideneamino] imidazole-4-carboxamide isomerase chloroplastic [Zea mays]